MSAKKEKHKKNYIVIDKIAKINTSDLPIPVTDNTPDEHFVYVRSYNRRKKQYRVQICTHLDKKVGNRFVNEDKRIREIKFGNIYPLPIGSTNFPLWTGIKKEIYIVPKGKMFDFNSIKFKRKYRKYFHDSFFRTK